MSFTNQTLNAEYIVKNYKRLEKKVYPVPPAIDKEIARLKLDSMGISIDTLTTEQKKYLASWEMGTQRAWCGAGALSARSPRMQD